MSVHSPLSSSNQLKARMPSSYQLRGPIRLPPDRSNPTTERCSLPTDPTGRPNVATDRSTLKCRDKIASPLFRSHAPMKKAQLGLGRNYTFAKVIFEKRLNTVRKHIIIITSNVIS